MARGSVERVWEKNSQRLALEGVVGTYSCKVMNAENSCIFLGAECSGVNFLGKKNKLQNLRELYTEIKSFSMTKENIKKSEDNHRGWRKNVCDTHNKGLYFKELPANVQANYKQPNKNMA